MREQVSEAEARRRYIRGQLDKVRTTAEHYKIQLRNYEGDESFWLTITEAQRQAIEKILLPEPASPVSHAPCIQGTIEIGQRSSEFLIPLDRDDVGFSQWGADNTVLWARVDLLDEMSKTAKEWAIDNLCRTCHENMLNDGEGYDGECGDCADRNPDNREDNDDD